jgi:hypothetical protein
MDFDECIRFATEHSICAVATVDDDQPRVRMLGMWFAANEGFYFSTAKVKARCRTPAPRGRNNGHRESDAGVRRGRVP